MTDSSPQPRDAPIALPERPLRSEPAAGRRMGALRRDHVALVGLLNVIYGFVAIGDSRFFVNDATFILSGLSTWGWIMLLIGAAQLAAAYSIWLGGETGLWFGIAVASLNAIAALMSISAYPFWSLAVFTLDILVIYGLASYGGDPRVVE